MKATETGKPFVYFRNHQFSWDELKLLFVSAWLQISISTNFSLKLDKATLVKLELDR